MSFTDDDLEQLEKHLNSPELTAFNSAARWLKLGDLLARLRAAEDLASYYGDGTPLTIIEAWRKAAGK